MAKKAPFVGLTSAVVGGVVSAAILASVVLIIGFVSTYEAGILIESILPTARFLGSSVLTASATTLALMLTLLGLSSNLDERLADAHYLRVRLIARIDTAAFIGSALLLVLLVIPFTDASEVEGTIYLVVYYSIVGGSAVLAGLMITVVLMIYQTIDDMVGLFLSGVDSHLVEESE